MTAGQLISLDLLAAALAAVGWLGSGAAAASGRTRLAAALAALGLLATAGWIAADGGLAGYGWWFVEEQAVLLLPLAALTGLAAVILAGPGLLGGVRGAGGPVRPVATTALFVAGYAAAAELVVPLLVGYPVTAPVALVTVALVVFAGLITWSSVGSAGVLDRRPRYAAAAVAGVLLLGGVGLAFRAGPAVDAGGGAVARHPAGHGTSVTTLTGTDPAGAAVRRYTLTARTGTVTLASGRKVAAWTFNGQAPGPELTATQGDRLEVTLRNVDIQAGVTIHWHGYPVPGAEDGAPGVTQAAVKPGQQFVYRFVATRTGTYWYHTHEVSDRGVRMGLYGVLVVTPRGAPGAGLDLAVPVHTFAGVTALGNQDRLDRRPVPAGTPVRLRLVNTDSGTHRLTLSGAPYRLTAVDGTDLNGPGVLTRTTLRLVAGGRYDLSFTMPGGPVALLVDNQRGAGLRLAPDGVATPATAPDTGAWPDLDLIRYGTPATQPYTVDSHFDRRFTLVLDRGVRLAGGRPGYDFTINGGAYPSTATMLVFPGDLVLMTVVNRGLDIHPWHLHGHTVAVLSIDGQPARGSPLWMDTFEVRPGEVWQVAFRADNPGVWMNHCHNLQHADQGMMAILQYDGVTSPFRGGHGA
jgi:FtsP/CotA-like multicopper oxidase with cupredoxin domain